MQVIDDPKDPVFVSPALMMGGKILLYIGERRRGRTRIASLTTGEARIVAYALMSLAEQKDEHYRQMNREARQAKRRPQFSGR
jgi:predicted site-specific integrase-resolvase